MSWTPERIQQQREIAKRLVEEGRFGGAGRGQGRPRKPRPQQKVAELSANDGKIWYATLMEILTHGSESNRLLALRELRYISEKERELEEREEQGNVDSMRKDQLLAFVVNKLMELGENGVIPAEIIDGEATEIADPGLTSPGEAIAESL